MSQKFGDRIRPWQCATCGKKNISANKAACPKCHALRAGAVGVDSEFSHSPSPVYPQYPQYPATPNLPQPHLPHQQYDSPTVSSQQFPSQPARTTQPGQPNPSAASPVPPPSWPGAAGPAAMGQQPPQPPRGGGRLRGTWARYRGASRNAQVGIGCASLIVVCLLCGGLVNAFGNSGGASSTSTNTNGSNGSSSTGIVARATSTSASATATLAATATPKPTPKPKPTPTDTAVPAPPTPPPAQLAIAFTCASAVDYSTGRVCVHTDPGAALTITVTYCSGYTAKSASLQGTSYADGSGNHEWDWTPETKCKGTATADVTATWQGQSAENTDDFNVG